MLFDVCLVVEYVLFLFVFVVCCMLCVGCWLSFVVGSLLCVGCCVLVVDCSWVRDVCVCVVCWLLFVV